MATSPRSRWWSSVRATCIALLLLLLGASSLPAAAQAPGPAGGDDAASPVATNGVLMSAGDTVDLTWNVSDLTNQGYSVSLLELFRGTSSQSMSLIASFSDLTKSFYRDTPLTVGSKYYYEMVASVCKDICWRYRWWTGAADTTNLYGTLTMDLKLKPGSYTGTLWSGL